MIIKEVKVKNIINKSKLPGSDYAANPYIGCSHSCRYCYASFMKRFTDHHEDWGSFVDVKFWDPLVNIEQYCGKKLFIGSVTDPYLPQEKIYQRTRSLLEELLSSDIEITISTKSDLILRDLDLIRQFPNITVAWSINTTDEKLKSDMDKAVSIKRRLKAMEIFFRQGIKTVCFISPIFPVLTDVEAIIKTVENSCNFIWLENLNLRSDYKVEILKYIKEEHPEIYAVYDRIYNKHDFRYWQELDSKLQVFAELNNFNYIDYREFKSFDMPPLFSNNVINHKPLIINCFYHSDIRKK